MAEQTVTLQPGESKVVSFEAVPQEARTYQVSVDGLTGSFRAIEAAPAQFVYASNIYPGFSSGVPFYIDIKNIGGSPGTCHPTAYLDTSYGPVSIGMGTKTINPGETVTFSGLYWVQEEWAYPQYIESEAGVISFTHGLGIPALVSWGIVPAFIPASGLGLVWGGPEVGWVAPAPAAVSSWISCYIPVGLTFKDLVSVRVICDCPGVIKTKVLSISGVPVTGLVETGSFTLGEASVSAVYVSALRPVANGIYNQSRRLEISGAIAGREVPKGKYKIIAIATYTTVIDAYTTGYGETLWRKEIGEFEVV